MKDTVKILILEEQPQLADLLQTALGQDGIRFQVGQAATNEEFASQLPDFAPDLILVHHAMPVCDGLAALVTAQQSCRHVPFIIMCPEKELETAMRSLRQGATDYVVQGRIERLAFAVRRALREVEERQERQRAAAALQEMEERYRALFDRSLDCLYVHDLEGRFLDANPAALALLGYSREEIPSVHFQSLISADQLPKAMSTVEEVLQTGTQQHSTEFVLKHKNGSLVVADIKASLILRDGKPFAMQGIARDTTERKRAEMELRRMNRLYAVLSHVNQTLIRAHSPEELLQQVCSITVAHGGIQSARIGCLVPVSRRVVPVATAGGPEEFISQVPIDSDDRPEAQGPTGTAMRERRICIFNDLLADPRSLPWLKSAEQCGVKAAASFPILFRGELYGALSLYVAEKQFFQEKEVVLLSGVAEAISSGLDRLDQEAQRKRAEQSLLESREVLRKSDARYRRLVQETGQVVYDNDLASGRIEWEGAMQEVLGYSWEEMQRIGVHEWEQLVHPEDREQTLAHLDLAITHGQRYRVEYRFRRKDGVYISVDEHGSFLRDEPRHPLRMLGTISDITERKSSEDRIREQARLLDLAHDAILARDLDDTIIYWNQSAERLYGWSAEEAIGRNVDDLLHEDSPKAAEGKKTVLQQDEWNDEVMHTTKSGARVLVETRLTLVRDWHGQPKSILAINSDITARKKLEAQLLRSQRMESIGTLASGIAHDLNNVLAPILMSCQLLSSYNMEGERKQWLEIISRSAQRGADLVKQVLSFCRGAEGRCMELQVDSVITELKHIVHETFPKSIKIRTRLNEDLWNILADPTQLHQVLLNLCVNARDAMPNGGVLTIGAENVMLDDTAPDGSPEAKPRPHLMIVVSDTGTGIPPEIREKIFDPFFTTKDLGRGTGLGLSTSLGIVKSHGGFINVYSEPGAGSVFKVYLPAMAESHAALQQADEEQRPRGNGETILLVDDEAAVRSITAQTLQTYGYKVIPACDGAEALELYGRHTEDVALILMDMMMPVMDGPATIHALCRHNQNLKVIAASGLSAEVHLPKTPPGVVKAFLSKPYTVETLLRTVHEVLVGRGKIEPADEPTS